jgi:hypothetical protein
MQDRSAHSLPPVVSVVATGLFVLLLSLSGCGAFNECSFLERCDGDVRQICGGGPDQQVGREITDLPCPEAAPVCVEEGDRTYCTTEEPGCDDEHERRCGGNAVLSCQSGTIEALDCDWRHPTIAPMNHYPDSTWTCEEDGEASCVREEE